VAVEQGHSQDFLKGIRKAWAPPQSQTYKNDVCTKCAKMVIVLHTADNAVYGNHKLTVLATNLYFQMATY